jgi:long-chain acyl-CoA synthetase
LPIICNPSGPQNKPGTLGRPGRKDIEIKIVNEKKEEVAIGQIGEILIKSPTTMSGYYNLPDDTEEILKDGWLYTGDLGKIDKDGFLYFHGLIKKIFNIYGNKVDPLEVKNMLLKHPFIEKVNIYLEILSDDGYIIGSKRICADIYVREGKEISSVEIRDYCYEKVASYKIPGKFNFYA